jgi:hypothetical protein
MTSHGGFDTKTGPSAQITFSYIYLRDGLSFATLFARIGHRTAKLGFFMPPKRWVSGPDPTHVKHLNGTYHHTLVLPCLRTTCWDHKNRMLCRRFREYSRAKVWKFRISGRPNHGMPRNRGWATNPNTSDRSRDGPHLHPASPFTSPSTQASVRLFNELKYS